MKDQRIVPRGPEELADALLQSARQDAPPSTSMERTAALLGLAAFAVPAPAASGSAPTGHATGVSKGAGAETTGAGSTGVGTTGVGAPGAGTTGASGGVGASVSTFPLVSVVALKTVGVLLGLGTTIIGTVIWAEVSSRAPTPATPQQSTPAESPRAPESQAKLVEEDLQVPDERAQRPDGQGQVPDGQGQVTDGETQVLDEKAQVTTGAPQVAADAGSVAGEASRSASSSRHGLRRPALATDGLRREIQSLASVRKHLESGDGARALSALESYEGEFARAGVLQVEAEVLEVEALLLVHGPAMARKAALAFGDKYPGSIHQERLLQLNLTDGATISGEANSNEANSKDTNSNQSESLGTFMDGEQ